MVSGGSFFLGGLNKDTRRCFLWCLQVSSSSSLLFNIEFWSAVRITSFSVRHRSHVQLPLENGWPLALIDQFTKWGIFLSFRKFIFMQSHFCKALSLYYFFNCVCTSFFLLLGQLVGDCVDDQFSVTGGLSAGTPTICGTNTGYHSKSEAIFVKSPWHQTEVQLFYEFYWL